MPETLLIPPSAEPVNVAYVKNVLRETSSAQDDILEALIPAAREAAESRTRQQCVHARYRLTIDKFPMAGIGTPLPFVELVNDPGFSVRLPHSPLVDVAQVQYLDMSGATQTVDPSLYTANKALMPGIVALQFGKVWPIPLPQIAAVWIDYDAGYASPFSVTDEAAGSIQVVGPVTWAVGDLVKFYSAGGASGLPAPLDGTVLYRVASANIAPQNELYVATYTFTDLLGNAIHFTSGGTAQSFMGVVPAGIRNWICMRVGSLYQNREEVALLNRGKIEQLPFVDSLLWPYITSLP
ncbi:phage head-tail connector protein [Burkholderia pseudomallei]|uniref:head-tail connector protein n=1 Tax=Burkholderia pseudomallei TaxID=28450 RepID=UPI00235F8D06|nr:phage head-tail connector protein [Burkholderia pseudomallei]